MKFKLVLILLPLVMALHSRAQLTINISNIQKLQGELYIAVYDDAESYMNVESAVQRKIINVEGNIARVVISGLAEGKYAIAIFQDLNGNSMLDTKKGRIPAEPFGFSNDARGKVGPPNFDKASFVFKSKGEIDIKMVSNERKH